MLWTLLRQIIFFFGCVWKSFKPYICKAWSTAGPWALHRCLMATVPRIMILVIWKINAENCNFAYDIVFFLFNISALLNFHNEIVLRVKFYFFNSYYFMQISCYVLHTDFVTIFLHLQDFFVPRFFQMVFF